MPPTNHSLCLLIPMLTQAGMTTTDANLTGVREGMTVTGTINGTLYTEADNIVVYDLYRHSDTEHRVCLLYTSPSPRD